MDLVEGTDQAKDIAIPVLVTQGDRDYVVKNEWQKKSWKISAKTQVL